MENARYKNEKRYKNGKNTVVRTKKQYRNGKCGEFALGAEKESE